LFLVRENVTRNQPKIQQSTKPNVSTAIQRESFDNDEPEEGVVHWISDAVDGAAGWVEDAGDSAADWVSDQADQAVNWGSETATEAAEFVEQSSTDAVQWAGEQIQSAEAWVDSSPVSVDGPDLGGLDLSALVDQASVKVVNDAQAPKLPRLQEADELLARAESVLANDRSVTQVDKDLPRPSTGAGPSECCSRSTLQSLRVSLDAACSNLKSGIASFKNAQRATKIACEQAKRTCLLSLGGGFLGSGIAIATGAGWAGVPVALAACVACLAAAYPVENAIRSEQETYDALLLNMDSLRKALANYQTCEVGLAHCPPDPANPGSPVMDLGDVDEWPETRQPVLDLGEIEGRPDDDE
jgi:hypothetical protein